MGKSTPFRNGPRRIDLDVLLFGRRQVSERGLIVPHPRMHSRRFVLEPLAEIAPRAVHPGLRRTAAPASREARARRARPGVGRMDGGNRQRREGDVGSSPVERASTSSSRAHRCRQDQSRQPAGQALLGQEGPRSADENPFLPQFYETRNGTLSRRSSSSCSRAFASSRSSRQQDLFQQFVVADYLFDRDRIFAYLNLDDNELALYEQIYGLLKARVTVPDVVIYLQASTDVLVERIARRNRAYEKHSRGSTSRSSTRPTTTSSSTTPRRRCWSSTPTSSTSCRTRSTLTTWPTRSARQARDRVLHAGAIGEEEVRMS